MKKSSDARFRTGWLRRPYSECHVEDCWWAEKRLRECWMRVLCGWVMPLLLLLLVLGRRITLALVCISHHEYYEEGKTRVINLGRCGSINGFCVKAHYWDKDAARKRGFSRGCDKNDCVHFGKREYGWQPDGCRKHRDFGSEGLICCCQHDLCNGSASVSTSMLTFCLLVLPSLKLHPMFF